VTKTEIKAIINSCVEQRNLCRTFFRYEGNYRYYFPLASNDKLFLGAEEDDFIIDGYSIRRFVDVTKAEVKKDKTVEILEREGIVDSIQIPSIDISNWETIFTSLKDMNINIIVEKESLRDEECEFIIGRIDRVYKKYAYVYHFDADGIWQGESFRIPYTEITSVSFGTRYIEIFSKYLEELPKNFSDKC